MNFTDIPQQELYYILTDLVSTPLAFTLGDGTFLWVNQAYANMVDYSITELVGKDGVSWKTLTADKADLQDDEENVERLTNGLSDRYTIVKKYRRKTGGIIPVRLLVTRYPRAGEIGFFVVSATELNNGYKDAFDYADQVIKGLVNNLVNEQGRLRDEVSKLHQGQTVFQQNLADSLWVGEVCKDIFSYLKERPKTVLVITIVICCLIFGDSTLTFMERVKNAFQIIYKDSTAKVTDDQSPRPTVLPP